VRETMVLKMACTLDKGLYETCAMNDMVFLNCQGNQLSQICTQERDRRVLGACAVNARIGNCMSTRTCLHMRCKCDCFEKMLPYSRMIGFTQLNIAYCNKSREMSQSQLSLVRTYPTCSQQTLFYDIHQRLRCGVVVWALPDF
jgi:hypothetical protein